jgi:hypothetical protein
VHGYCRVQGRARCSPQLPNGVDMLRYVTLQQALRSASWTRVTGTIQLCRFSTQRAHTEPHMKNRGSWWHGAPASSIVASASGRRSSYLSTSTVDPFQYTQLLYWMISHVQTIGISQC